MASETRTRSKLGDWVRAALKTETAARTRGEGVGGAFSDFAGRLVTPMQLAAETATACVGDRVLANICTTLRKLDGRNMFPRSQIQKELHELYTNAEMQHVYGPEFAVKMHGLMVKRKTADFHPMIGVSMPRRFGKTQSVAQHNAVMLACMERDFIIAVFSAGARASKMLLKLTYFVLLKLCPDIEPQVVVNNAETLQLIDPNTGINRTMNSYPGGVRLLFSRHCCCCFCLFFPCPINVLATRGCPPCLALPCLTGERSRSPTTDHIGKERVDPGIHRLLSIAHFHGSGAEKVRLFDHNTKHSLSLRTWPARSRTLSASAPSCQRTLT